VLAAADIEVFTTTATFQIMQSLRSTAGPADRATPDRNAAGPGQRRSWCGPGDLRAGLDQAGHTAVIKPQAPQATVEGGFTPGRRARELRLAAGRTR
jgi:hypothetical protein